MLSGANHKAGYRTDQQKFKGINNMESIKYELSIKEHLDVLLTLIECSKQITDIRTKEAIYHDIRRVSESLSLRCCYVYNVLY